MAKDKEWHKQYYLKNREKLLAKQNAYYKENKDVYKTYYENNKEKIIDYQNEYQKEYDKTPIARANSLLSAYKQRDKKTNRGVCTLTAKWIVENIFSSKCRYCGKDDWIKLGCDRIDNALPHTPDNVVPCCEECNIERGSTPYEEFLKIKGAS